MDTTSDNETTNNSQVEAEPEVEVEADELDLSVVKVDKKKKEKKEKKAEATKTKRTRSKSAGGKTKEGKKKEKSEKKDKSEKKEKTEKKRKVVSRSSTEGRWFRQSTIHSFIESVAKDLNISIDKDAIKMFSTALGPVLSSALQEARTWSRHARRHRDMTREDLFKVLLFRLWLPEEAKAQKDQEIKLAQAMKEKAEATRKRRSELGQSNPGFQKKRKAMKAAAEAAAINAAAAAKASPTADAPMATPTPTPTHTPIATPSSSSPPLPSSPRITPVPSASSTPATPADFPLTPMVTVAS